MKRITLLSIVTVFIAGAAQAQIGKGTVMLGGSVSGGNSKSEDNLGVSKSKGFSISPSVGVAVKDNIVVGVFANYGHSKNEYSTNIGSSATNTNVGGGVYVRTYAPLSKRFYLFGNGSFNYSYSKSESDFTQNNRIYKSNGVGIGLYPGVAFDVNKWLQLETSLPSFISVGYSRSRAIIPGVPDVKSRQFSAGINVSPATDLNLGIRILLR